MAHGLSPVTLKDVPKILEAEPFKLPTGLRVFFIALIVLGVLGFVNEVLARDPQRAWIALHVNFTYWFCLAAASSCFTAVFHICNAQWVRPIRRIFESGSNFFTLSPLILAVLYLGSSHLFIWTHEKIPGKEVWLTPGFVYTRDILAMCLLVYVGRKIVYLSVRRDIGAIRSGLTGLSKSELGRWSNASYDHYVEGWNGNAVEELKKTSDRMGTLSPIVVWVYALVMSLVAFDQLMSVEPEWYSTMFGGFIFMSAVYLAFAWSTIVLYLGRKIHPLFRAKVERRTLHDLGKLLFGFGIFWAYLFWSQYLPIWYGNMPEETKWIIGRLREHPWHDLAWVVLGSCFIIPFLLGISRDVKQIPILLCATGFIVAIGIWLQQYLLFTPSHFPHEIPLGLTDLCITLGFAGAYILSAASFLEKVPLIPFGDLYQKEH